MGRGCFRVTGGSELADGRSHPLPPAEGWRAAGGASTTLRHGAPEPPALLGPGSHVLMWLGINRVRASTRWVITDKNFQDVCDNPFRPLKTEIGSLGMCAPVGWPFRGLNGDWGFVGEVFEEHVV